MGTEGQPVTFCRVQCFSTQKVWCLGVTLFTESTKRPLSFTVNMYFSLGTNHRIFVCDFFGAFLDMNYSVAEGYSISESRAFAFYVLTCCSADF